MTNKKERQAPKLRATGSLAKPLLPYDGRYVFEGGEPSGIFSLFPGAARYRREQQIAKLPAVIAALELDRTDKDLVVNLLLALCERVFPIGFKEDSRGRHKENPERKRDTAFKMVHLYQVEMLSRGLPIPSWQACAAALSKRMRCPSMGSVGPALKAAIDEAIDAGVTPGSIRRKGFDSPEKAKRKKVGIEAYQLGLNNALYEKRPPINHRPLR